MSELILKTSQENIDPSDDDVVSGVLILIKIGHPILIIFDDRELIKNLLGLQLSIEYFIKISLAVVLLQRFKLRISGWRSEVRPHCCVIKFSWEIMLLLSTVDTRP